jgi:conjugative transfer signal peptidase TraF
MSHGQLGSLARIARAVLVGIGLCIATFQVCGWLGFRINMSPSLPVGLYMTTAASGLIEFCPAAPLAQLTMRRGYRDRGVCLDGGAPLLKPTIAIAGDEVSLSSLGFAVNGVQIPNTAPLPADTNGRPLRHWPYGSYRVAAGTIWVASGYNARSFDSRYFGPVPLAAIRDRVKPIVTF